MTIYSYFGHSETEYPSNIVEVSRHVKQSLSLTIEDIKLDICFAKPPRTYEYTHTNNLDLTSQLYPTQTWNCKHKHKKKNVYIILAMLRLSTFSF